MNPLLEEFNTPFETTPFSKINTTHFKPAFERAIEIAQQEIDTIVENPSNPSFENTIEALEYSGQLLNKVSNIFFNLNSAETSDEMQQIAKEVSPLLASFSNDVSLNEELFKKIKTVFEAKQSLQLSKEQSTLLEKSYKNFVRNGANLNDTEKLQLRKIDKQLSEIFLNYGENILAETNNYELHITDASKLDGLPQSAIDAAKITAKQKNKDGWVFTLDMPSYLPFVTYSNNRILREEMTKAYGSRAFKNNEYDNQENILKIVKLRQERAKLLGYKTHSYFILEERMAMSPKNVKNFLDDLLIESKPIALKEYDELCKFSIKNGGPSQLESWDNAFYKEKLKQQQFDLNDEQLKPYFKLENVINGAFEIAKKLFGLNFEEVFDIDTYHEDVKTFKITDENGELVAIFYGDYFPREGKRDGAWMTSFKNQFVKDGKNHRPHIANVCNFTKPTETEPSLLTFNEVTVLFHEFGHALHGILANTTYPSLSGTNVLWDFVELPSQIFENWCYEKEALELFAFHYKTDEIIPIELIEKIKSSSNFMEASNILRQTNLGILDMSWHSLDDENITSVPDFEKSVTKNSRIYPPVKEIATSTQFSHIFSGGYSSGYYSYKWAEVLDADAFSYFKENGIFNKEIALKFRDNILSKGGTEHPMNLYKRFRGKEPTNKALLKRAGLIKETVS